jgi:hypothetical protein
MQAQLSIAATRAAAKAPTHAQCTAAWFKLSVAYLIVGVGLGIGMGASGNFALRPVHAHINLLGFTVLALAGLIYSVFPEAGTSRLARVHFWLHNLALPVMMGSLAAMLLGYPGAVPALVVSEVAAAAGVLAFAANVFINLRAAPAAAARRV